MTLVFLMLLRLRELCCLQTDDRLKDSTWAAAVYECERGAEK